MTTKEQAVRNELDNVIYNYTSITPDYEEENKLLKATVEQLKRELERFKSPALMVCDVREVFEDNAIIKIANGNEFFVNKSDTKEEIRAGDMVLVEQKNLTIVKKVAPTRKFNVEKFVIIEQPKLKWEEIGGLKEQINEVQEVVELPLKNPELFKKVGIHPPKGVLLYGPPGTGKTLIAKAVAASTQSTFIEIVSSELVQKFIGEGAKLVKEIFELARKKAPTIIFIDEIDALAATRMEIGTSGEREVNRTFMQLLAELDGFEHLGNVKVIGATNRKEILDAAIIRPGRLDRLIQIPYPDKDGIKQIFSIHSKRMKIDKRVKMDEVIEKMQGFSGAEIKAVCTEAGYFAIREDRIKITKKDLLDGIKKVKREERTEGKDYLNMFG